MHIDPRALVSIISVVRSFGHYHKVYHVLCSAGSTHSLDETVITLFGENMLVAPLFAIPAGVEHVGWAFEKHGGFPPTPSAWGASGAPEAILGASTHILLRIMVSCLES